MACRCGERRRLLRQAREAARQGRLGAAGQKVVLVIRSAKEDVAAVLRPAEERS